MEGARALFQTLVTDLVGVVHPDANEVAGPGGGDWGIDTYVGQLDAVIAVWQTKYFPDGLGRDQQRQVRESFKQLIAKADEHDFTVDAWTLCVPCVLAPEDQKWWHTWSRKQTRDHGIKMELHNAVELRRQLLRPDADHILRNYFDTSTAVARPRPEPVASSSDLDVLDETLFVEQLREAGLRETDAARGLFFASEALVRDLVARDDRHKIDALNELHLEVQLLWEQRFNSMRPSADSCGRIAGLLDAVLEAAASSPDPEGLVLRPAHRRGVVHRLVERGSAGWVDHWREIAARHEGPKASEALNEQLPAQPEATT